MQVSIFVISCFSLVLSNLLCFVGIRYAIKQQGWELGPDEAVVRTIKEPGRPEYVQRMVHAGNVENFLFKFHVQVSV